jgi:serine/threonine-protein kinase
MTVTTTADPLLGTVLDGRYRLDALIARGGMATVYAGFDTRLDRDVAVKVMHPALAADDAFVERFRREAKSAARLSHPSVVAIFDQGEDGGRVYLVMEHVAGRTLREVLREHGRLAPAQALDAADGFLTALAAAHAAGLVHRDVKPENAIVLPDGRVKVADFGLARAVEASHYSVADGTLLGTVAYLAPEQVATGAADPRADLYALGVVLFELLTGTVPYTGDTPLAVAYRHVNEDVPAPSALVPGLPKAVDEVVRAATRRDPDERYPDAEAMLSAVRRARATLGNTETSLLRLDEAPTVITKLPAAAPPPATPVKAKKDKRERRRRPWLVFTVVALAILLVAGLAGWYAGRAEYARTPSVEGLHRAAAVIALREAGLRLHEATPQHSDTVPAGAVISQDPDPGSRVEKGDVVTIRLSLGVKMVTVPSVVGKTQAEAERLLARADLERGAVATRYDEKVPKGRVISTSEPAGKSVKHDTKVSLVVSDGPAPVVVPDVRGRPLAEAQATLQGAGLRVVVREEFSETVERGRVVDQAPGAGGSVPKGSTVTLRVSKGPQVVAVPDLRGEPIQRAVQKLEALGLKAFVDHVRNGSGDIVLDQDPPGGTRVRVGTTVTLVAF